MPDEADAEERVAPSRRRRWPRRAVVAGVVVVIGAWLGLCAYRMVQADHELRQAVAQSQQLRASLTTQELTSGGATPQLRQAAAEFVHAHDLLAGPLMAPLRWLPIAGRQLNSAIDLSGSAGRIAAEGTTALDQVHTLLNAPHHTPGQRATVVQNLASVVARLDTDVASANLGPSTGLIGTLADKRDTFADDLSKLQIQLNRARGATAALATLLTGPRRYLVLSANNAEMRAGSGMFLSAGTVTVNQGTLTLSTFTPTSELLLPTAQVPLSGDLAALWGYTEPNQEFRNLELSPQFPASAALAAQMWQARTGQHVDGVLVLDVGALSDILSATGQVTSDGQTFDAQSIIPFLLNGQYQGLSTNEQEAARHQRDGDHARLRDEDEGRDHRVRAAQVPDAEHHEGERGGVGGLEERGRRDQDHDAPVPEERAEGDPPLGAAAGAVAVDLVLADHQRRRGREGCDHGDEVEDVGDAGPGHHQRRQRRGHVAHVVPRLVGADRAVQVVVPDEPERQPGEERREEGLGEAGGEEGSVDGGVGRVDERREREVAGAHRERGPDQDEPRVPGAIEEEAHRWQEEEDAEAGQRRREADGSICPASIVEKVAQVRRADSAELGEEEVDRIQAVPTAGAGRRARARLLLSHREPRSNERSLALLAPPWRARSAPSVLGRRQNHSCCGRAARLTSATALLFWPGEG